MKLNQSLNRFAVIAAFLFSTNLFGQELEIDDSDLELPPVVTAAEQKIDALAETISKLDRYIGKLDSATTFNMPLGIAAEGKDPSYSIMIDTVMFKADRAFFNASMRFVCPNDGSTLAFRAENVPLTRGGGLTDPIKLQLVSQRNIKVGNGMYICILPGSEVSWDCSGFKTMKLKAKLILSRRNFIPVTSEGKDIPKARVSAFFETTINDWNDLTLSLSLDPFRLTKLPDIFFECRDIALDFSDLNNPSNLVFPANYQSLYPADNINLWRGLFIGKAEVKLGKKFQKKNAKSLTTFSSTNLLIDENGFTGELAATNLLSLDEGDMSGWSFSLENINVKLEQNELTAASLKGQIHVPSFKDGTNFGYSAFIDNAGNYNFNVRPGADLPFELFGNSKLTLYETSWIEIKGDGDSFVPTANLSGELSIACGMAATDTSSANKDFEIAGIKFEEMRISTQEPMFSVKRFSVDSDIPGALAKFPFTINNIGVRNLGNNFQLDFTAFINLTKSSEEGFKGSTTISLKSERVGQTFKFKGVTVNAIRVDIVKPGAFELHGQVAFAKGDSIYGSGFRGALKAKFAEKFELEAVAVFGSVRGTRYFFTDAMFAAKPGIPAGAISLFGFSGGLYQHMRQKAGTVDENSFGASRSGLVYEPDPSIGIGIMAGVKFGVCSEKIISAEAKFEIVFTSSGGLSRIGFEGNAQCITPEVPIKAGDVMGLAQNVSDGKKLTFTPKGAISASLLMEMDFQKKSFHAELAAYVNVFGVLKGTGENGKAGWGVVHIDQEKWYIHIGSPYDPIGMELLNFASVNGYFMMGHDIPTALPLNAKVAQILDIDNEEGGRDNNQIAKGRGIAFGANFEVNTGQLNFLIFYAQFEVGAGFDIMLIDFGNEAYCKGHAAPLGINGWYAKGQAYAYLAGEIGIRVKVFGIKKNFEILSIAAAVLFRAEGPNPVYLRGYAGGEFSILGGAIRGKCRFKVTVGEKCDIVAPGQGLDDLKIIGDISPSDKSSDVDVFTVPQIAFNIPVEKEIKITDDNEIQRKFLAHIKKFELTNGSQTIKCNTRWNSDHSVLIMEPDVILNPKTEYTIHIEVGFEEYVPVYSEVKLPIGGSVKKVVGMKWATFQENGQDVLEIRNEKFVTGLLPDKIPSHAILYTYPIDRQYNFYKQEYGQAYIKFNRDITPYFSFPDRRTELQWLTTNGTKTIGTYEYNAGERFLTAGIPESLALNTIYSFNLTSIATDQNKAIDKNVSTKTENVDLQDTSANLNIDTKEADGVITDSEDKIIYSIKFRTSKFNKFLDKFPSSNKDVDYLKPLYAIENGKSKLIMDEYFLGTYYYNDNEAFDKYEIYGITEKGLKPLIQGTAVLESTPWYVEEIQNLIYGNIPYQEASKVIKWRDVNICGLPPKNDIRIWQAFNNYPVLTDPEIETGVQTQKALASSLFYTMPYYWSEDYYGLRNYLAYKYSYNLTSNELIDKVLMNFSLRPVKPGLYPLKLDYILPGINKTTSSKTIVLKNDFKTMPEDYN